MSKSMTYLTPKTSIAALNAEQQRAADAQAVAEIMFVQAATAEQLDEQTIIKFPSLFVEWDENWRGKAGDIVQDEGNPLEEFPEWVQPLGAHDAYSKGAKVSHNGEKWTSDVDSNVWEPGVYGWTKYVEPEAAAELAEEAVEPEESSAEE